MKGRVFVGVMFLIGALTPGVVARTGDVVASGAQSALVNVAGPLKVGSHFLMGQYLIVHDYDRDARGEPCTTIYEYDSSKGRGEEVVAFMCIPAHRAIAEKFTLKTRLDWEFSTTAPIARLIEYQFAGDATAHQVPRHEQ